MSMYYIYINEEQVGPLSIEQLKTYPLTPSSRIWCQGMADWGSIKDRPEVMSALSLTIAKKKPKINGMMYANIVIQLFVTLSFFSILDEYQMGDVMESIFISMFVGCFILNIISLFIFMQRNYRLAKILSIIACIPFIPIGMVGIIGMNKAIEKVTLDI